MLIELKITPFFFQFFTEKETERLNNENFGKETELKDF